MEERGTERRRLQCLSGRPEAQCEAAARIRTMPVMDAAGGDVPLHGDGGELRRGRKARRRCRAVCAAGSADRTAPEIVVVSPPTSALVGRAVRVKAVCYWMAGATMPERRPPLSGSPATKEWKRLDMARRVRSVFVADIPGQRSHSLAGLEYYIQATDGDNAAVFPASAPAMPLSLVATGFPGRTPPGAPGGLAVKDRVPAMEPGSRRRVLVSHLSG